MMTNLQVLRQLKPQSGVLENVTGLRDSHSSDGVSPLEYIRNQLEEMQYKSGIIDADLGSWITASRKRTALLLQRFDIISVTAS